MSNFKEITAFVSVASRGSLSAAARAEAVVGLLTARGLLADLRRDGATTHLLLRRETLQ